MKIMIINGVNMNMLGIREPDIYGSTTYAQLCDYVREACADIATLTFFQSNSEGAIVDCIHSCHFDGYDGIVINPAAHTHYSYAIHDAIKAIKPPAVEVHISNIHARESFRSNSVVAPACKSQICGKGLDGYVIAVKQIVNNAFEDVL